MITKFFVTWGYEPSLTKVNVLRESDKTFTATIQEEIMGWVWIGKRTTKNNNNALFDTMAEAKKWLLDRAEKSIKAREDQLIEAQKEKERIKMLG